jgi:RHS repeat-associated protein
VYSDGTPGVVDTYDRLGRLSSSTSAEITDTFNYNLANELLGESFSGGPLDGLSVSDGYDMDLRRTTLAVAAGSTVLSQANYGYDAAGRLASVNDGNQNTETYSYLANSPLVGQIVYATNGMTRMTMSKQYDFLNRLTQISSAPGGAGLLPYTYSYKHNLANQRTQNAFADGSHWKYEYDWLGQVTNGGRFWSDGTPVAGQQYQYAFDTIGNRTQTRTGGDVNGTNLRVANYTVNNLNQITRRDVAGTFDVAGAALQGASVTVNGFAADRKLEYFHGTAGGNNSDSALWQTVTLSGAGTSAGGSLYVPQTPEQFVYDLDGNLMSDGRWTYTWDAENRLISMTVNSRNPGPQYQLTFAYDSKGRRIQKTVSNNGVTSITTFLYDGWNLIATLSPLSTRQSSYVWGTDLSGSAQGAGGVGGLLEVTYDGASTTNAFAAYDGNGNVSALVNAGDGTVVGNYEYGPFGEVIRNSGPMGKNNPFRFSTKYQDDESDFLYYGYRYYKASTGTWVNRDPKKEKGGLNLYGFIRNDGVNKCDFLGLDVNDPPTVVNPLQLGYTTVQPPFKGKCGVFYVWSIAWSLSQGAACGGFVVQHSTTTGNITDNDGNPVKFQNADFLEILGYISEYHTTTGSGVDDGWSNGKSYPGTKGTIMLTGTAKFYDNGNPDDSSGWPPGFVSGDYNAPWFAAPHSSSNQLPQGGIGPIKRTLIATWDCCCGKEQDTQITYP